MRHATSAGRVAPARSFLKQTSRWPGIDPEHRGRTETAPSKLQDEWRCRGRNNSAAFSVKDKQYKQPQQTMNTMTESMKPETEAANQGTIARPNLSHPRELMLTWLIVIASVVMAIQVFRAVAMQLEVNNALDRLYESAGESLISES
ncbi:MAG: hypothetical protein KJ070_04320 [Verrucomicrobia bacterium]|nr:hypothetical protein [Verrucomicrobiota bacterium]